jgi:hypothetical protein
MDARSLFQRSELNTVNRDEGLLEGYGAQPLCENAIKMADGKTTTMLVIIG